MIAEALSRFKPGDPVRVSSGDPPGHYRTPIYIQGKRGHVVAAHGPYRDPETLAQWGDGLPKQPLYQVRFLQLDVWGHRYTGPRFDTICVDIYSHWLEPG